VGDLQILFRRNHESTIEEASEIGGFTKFRVADDFVNMLNVIDGRLLIFKFFKP
jgi:hypothetical protein